MSERGLGTQGLNLLFRNTPDAEMPMVEVGEQKTLPVNVLRRCATQPRQFFDEESLDELAASIRKQGILQPIIVRPLSELSGSYEIVAGERRWRAAQRAGLTDVPVLIRELSDSDVLIVALVENLQREDLNPMEEAEAMHTVKEQLEISQEALAERLGKSRSAVANSLRLLQLSVPMRRALQNGEISAGHARTLLSLTEETLQAQLFEAIVSQNLSVRDAESAVSHWKKYGKLPDGIQQGTPTEGSSTSRKQKPLVLQNIQQFLRNNVHPKLTVAGSEDIGRITIPYESAEQFADVLQRLGLSDEEKISLQQEENQHEQQEENT